MGRSLEGRPGGAGASQINIDAGMRLAEGCGKGVTRGGRPVYRAANGRGAKSGR